MHLARSTPSSLLSKAFKLIKEFTVYIIRTWKEGIRGFTYTVQMAHKFMIINGILCRQSRKSSTKPKTQILVPKCLRKFIFDQLHVKSEHFGIYKTFEKISEQLFGLDMSWIFVVQLKNVNDVNCIINQCRNLKPPYVLSRLIILSRSCHGILWVLCLHA